MTVEGLKTAFDWITVILLFLTFAAGAGVLITGNIINERQSKQLKQFDKDLRDKDVKIAEAQRDAADANTKAEGFRLDIAKANESAAQAQAQVADATAEAAKANLELARIRTPRTIPRGKEAVLSAELGVFSGQEFAAYTFQDQESMDLANAVGRILLGASWKLETPESDIVIGRLGTTPISGVQIQIAPESSGPVRSAADALARALKAEGIDSAVDSRNPARAKTPKTIHVLIGKKPT